MQSCNQKFECPILRLIGINVKKMFRTKRIHPFTLLYYVYGWAQCSCANVIVCQTFILFYENFSQEYI